MNDIDFYNECARLLNTTYDCQKFQYHRRTRWNNRTPGSGRFPGFGIIRLFGDTVQVHIREPKQLSATIIGRQAALDFLEKSLQ